MNLISLFSGAGGLDIGFKNAGFNLLWANDFDKDACETYKQNIGNHIVHGDIQIYEKQLYSKFSEIDLIIGGPPCQGFSVAGKMDPTDPRSRHVWTFVENIERIKPKAFVMENVGALGNLDKWKDIRTNLLYGVTGTKKTSAEWVKKRFGLPWSNLIELAVNWEYGKKLYSKNETINFIKFCVHEIKQTETHKQMLFKNPGSRIQELNKI